jgi:hypothetical protein
LEKDVRQDSRRWTTVLWRNRYGAFDSYTFDGSITTELNLDSLEYSRATLPSVISGYTYQADPPDRIGIADRSRLVTDARRRLVLNSGLVNAEHHEWLSSLVLAREVYIADTADNVSGPQGVWRAVTIVEQDWQRNTDANLFSLELTVEYAQHYLQ